VGRADLRQLRQPGTIAVDVEVQQRRARLPGDEGRATAEGRASSQPLDVDGGLALGLVEEHDDDAVLAQHVRGLDGDTEVVARM